jgi:MFS family permease
LLVMAGFGLFSGGMMALTNGLIALLSPAGRQGSAFGMASSSQALAMATAPLAGGAAASAFGVRSVFPIAAGMLVAVGVAAEDSIKAEAPDGSPSSPHGDPTPAPTGDTEQTAGPRAAAADI